MTNRPLTVAVAACLVVVAILFWRTSAPVSETRAKVVATQAPTAGLPPPMPLPPQPEEPAFPSPVLADPQLDLHTAMDDLAALWRAGDFIGAYRRYTPPATLAKHAANPRTMQAIEEAAIRAGVPGTPEYEDMLPIIQTLDLARDRKLFMKETGDTATYTLTNDPFARVVLSFVKVDGKWYRGQGLR